MINKHILQKPYFLHKTFCKHIVQYEILVTVTMYESHLKLKPLVYGRPATYLQTLDATLLRNGLQLLDPFRFRAFLHFQTL